MQHLAAHPDARHHQPGEPPDGAIPRHRPTHHTGIGHLHRSQCRDGAEERHRALGRGNQRRGKHALHDLHRHQHGHRHHQRLFQARDESRHGRGQCAEPCLESRGLPARRSDQDWRIRRETAEQPAQNHDPLRPNGYLRHQVSEQLLVHQRRAPNPAHHRRGRGQRDGQRLRHAHLAQARRDGTVRTGACGRHQRIGRAKHRILHRHLGAGLRQYLPIYLKI